MTNRVSYAPQDFRRMCEHAERDHESKRLIILMERVKRQLAERAGDIARAIKLGQQKLEIELERRKAEFGGTSPAGDSKT